MKLFFDFFIVALFFIAYQLYGIYPAVAFAVIAYPLQILVMWAYTKKLDKTQLFTAAIVIVLGSATLAFHNETFFKWKPTIVYWIFAMIALGSQFYGDKVISERLLGRTLTLSSDWWKKINLSWVVFFAVMGIANLFVVYYFSTKIWVYFKLFGLLGLTAVFMFGQIAYLTWRGAITEESYTK
jgi:intracellular septation protein